MTSVRTVTARAQRHALDRMEGNGGGANEGPPTINKADLYL